MRIRDRSHVKCMQDEVSNYDDGTANPRVGFRLSIPQKDVLIEAADSDGAEAGGACHNAKQVQPQASLRKSLQRISLGCSRTGNVSDAAKTTRPIPASSHSRVGMSLGCRMIQVPTSQPAPQPRPWDPRPTAEAVVRSCGGNQSADNRVKMFPMAGPAAAFSDCPICQGARPTIRGRH